MSDAGRLVPQAPASPVAGHEALLRRHGLISHVALLPEGTPPDAAARFRAEAARNARNLIPLAPDRFGILLDRPDLPLSDVPYTLTAGPLLSDGPAAPASRAPSPEAGRPSDWGRATPDGDDAPGEPDIARRLGRMEARLEAMELDSLAAGLAPALDDLLARRLEAMEDRLAARSPSPPMPAATPPAPDPLPPARVAAFWDGLEQALRLLHDKLAQLEILVDRTPDPGTGALGEIEAAVALGFEAAGEAREANHAALDARLSALEAHSAETAERLSHALEALAAKVTALPAPDDGEERSRALVGSVAALGKGLAALLDERVPQGAVGALAARLDELADQEAQAARSVARIDARLAETSDPAPSGGGDLIAALDERIAALAERLENRGGVLSDALHTSQRSMKNFWLAAEDALGRLDAALDRLDASASAPDSDGEIAPPQNHPP